MLQVHVVVVRQPAEEILRSMQVRPPVPGAGWTGEVVLAPDAYLIAQCLQLFDEGLFFRLEDHGTLGWYAVSAHAFPLQLLPQRIPLSRDGIEARHQVVLAAPSPHVWPRRALWGYDGAAVLIVAYFWARFGRPL